MGTLPDKWMSQLPKTLKLTDICIPGTHDSFTAMDKTCAFAPDNPLPAWLVSLANKSSVVNDIAKEIVMRWSIAQAVSPKAQLEMGMRYFDIRVAKNPANNQFYTHHGLYSSDSLLKSLTEINSFLSDHPAEIVILDLSHFAQMNDADHKQLITAVTALFGSKLAPASYTADVTLGKLWESNKQVILVYDNNIAYQYPKLLWPGDNINSPWPNKISVNEMLAFITNDLNQPAGISQFHVTQAILTPDTSVISKGVFLGWLPKGNEWAPDSLKDLARLSNPRALQWLKQQSDTKKVNIMIFDHVQLNGTLIVENTVERTIAQNHLNLKQTKSSTAAINQPLQRKLKLEIANTKKEEMAVVPVTPITEEVEEIQHAEPSLRVRR